MRKRTRELEDGSPDSDQPTKMFSKYEVQGLLQQEVHSAMKQSESKMESLLERVQLLECEPKYDLAIRKLEAHIKKVKRRGDAAISYVRMLGTPGGTLTHNQRMLGSGSVDLTETETERGLSSVDINRSDSDEEDRKKKSVDGFWQKMMSNKKAPDRKTEMERNGEKHSSPPPTSPPLSPVLFPQVPKVEASAVPVTGPPVMSPAPEVPVKTESAVKMENSVKTEDSSSSSPPVSPRLPVALRVPPTQSELLFRLPPLPPTPLPPSLPLEAASHSIPQKPLVHLARIRNPSPCLVIHWRVTEEDPAAPDMDSYSIYISQDSYPSWRNVGVVKALALPMAVTVTKYQSGTTNVIVVGKDRYGRYGPYSDVQTVVLA
ncbi:activating transcription factor 7-interacting protein 2 [Coregonus clupeaformis]|uniref:activating transcription factor 7-interacting protein 2 n=1 Tax=Coregonus clupeaformis TaxID=59861 RepID=UPI001E1C9962|nr:activating transcription factor 7-interacting protein 2 [Coregonus clupeaformis]